MGTPAYNTQSYIIPLSGTTGGLSGLPELPSPAQLAPSVMTQSSAIPQGNAIPTAPPLWPPCTTAPMLHTHAIALADPMAPIPPPQVLAPHVFMNAMPAATVPMQPQPAMARPPAPPMPPPAPPQPPAPAPAQPKAPVDPFDGALTDEIVKALNRQLNDPDEVTRASAATDLSKILEKHPGLSDSPEYKPIVDAFMEKIMKDPSTLVRGMGEMAFQLGVVPNPSEGVRSQLKSISKKDDKNLTKENDLASSILTGAENGTLGKNLENLLGKKKEVTPGDAANGAAAATANTPGTPAGPTGPAGFTQPASTASSAAAPAQPVDPASAGSMPSVPAMSAGMPTSSTMPTGMGMMPGYQAGSPITPQTAAIAAPAMTTTPMTSYQSPSGMGAYPANPYPMTAYGQPVAGSFPGGAAGPTFGSRLNILSTDPAMMSSGMAQAQTGQRLNFYEGPRS